MHGRLWELGGVILDCRHRDYNGVRNKNSASKIFNVLIFIYLKFLQIILTSFDKNAENISHSLLKTKISKYSEIFAKSRGKCFPYLRAFL